MTLKESNEVKEADLVLIRDIPDSKVEQMKDRFEDVAGEVKI